VKVALVHHWLVRMRGGEKVLEAVAELFPDADIFTLFYDPRGVSEALRRHRIVASCLDGIPYARTVHANLLPLFPWGVWSLNLSGYDLVISSDSALMKGVRVPRGALHICYCHSPPRYLWGMGEVYLRSVKWFKRGVARALFPLLRRWDRRAAQRVDHFVANSEHGRRRIAECYGREAEVIHPPVDAFERPAVAARDEYVLLGHLVPYKRADVAVEAFTRMGKPLVVIGEGPERRRLEPAAGPSVRFVGWQPDEVVRERLAACRALVFPGEEDFGIVPVEAQMAGRPVIAYGRGGALETVIDGKTGLFFDRPEPEALIEAVTRFESAETAFRRANIRRNALRFRRQVFLTRFREFVSAKLAEPPRG
jgi:glycosyltransferase involved in cell wall biosynthesis